MALGLLLLLLVVWMLPIVAPSATFSRSSTWIHAGLQDLARLDALALRATSIGSSSATRRHHHRRHSGGGGNKSEEQHRDELLLLRQLPPSASICKQLRGLSPGQEKLCGLSQDHMPWVARGAKSAIDECQHQFQHRRWNCSTTTLADSEVATDQNKKHQAAAIFGPVLESGSRETAFVHAIGAAGLVYTLARACRDGQLSSCGCSRGSRPKDLNREWIWGGCGDNLEYGYKFAQSFIDVREREQRHKRRSHEHGRSLVNLHNNEAGRRAVIKRSKVTCKCHGVSGSCSLITCWQQLASFREIGDYLLDKYDGATEVKVNRRGRLSIKDPRYSLPTANDLVYLDDSPNYCFANSSLGSLGTRGRTCNRTSTGIDGCNLLCCGRGYNTQKSIISERCDCKFHWCCEVQCSTCNKSLDVYTCK
ncbi:unnamed protein product [Trichogramma brassicae]|uniref:Protein Wnt n=1 Tax=Trichogramma brassicae TaxID=86971 RepID=A0A6H5I3Q5_9HYME|nr:unnamed protein product [Trichogramma brassicae]